jgi:hypothetical protein
MPSNRRRVLPHAPTTRPQLDEILDALCSVDPRVYPERKALVDDIDQRARSWQQPPIRLPRGVELVVSDLDGAPIHVVDWGVAPPPVPPLAFRDADMAVAFVWTVFMLHRPSAIDDERLRALVEHPPVARARIVGELLSIRSAGWVLEALYVMVQLCTAAPVPNPDEEALAEVFRSFDDLRRLYASRAVMAIHELSGLLGVEEPDANVGYEFSRWRWMLYDYTKALDPQLHDRIQLLGERYKAAERKDTTQAWDEVTDRRQIDACTGLFLARATMLDQPRSNTATYFVDAMATRAMGSFAWWCHQLLEALEDDYSLRERLRPEEIGVFINLATQTLERLDTGLMEALHRVFPSIRA